jgi:hypothetical protein
VRTAAGPEHVEIVDYHQEVARITTLTPIHPGEVLIEDFIEPLGVTQQLHEAVRGDEPR